MNIGRTKGEPVQLENPFLNAKRTWNIHYGSLVTSRQSWQLIGMLSMLIALAAVGGVIHFASQVKVVPYVIEVDELGKYLSVGVVSETTATDQRVIEATLRGFIENARLVTPDIALQRKAIFDVYSLLLPGQPSLQKMNEWLNGSSESVPFKRSEKEIVHTEIVSCMPLTEETWQIDWRESVRNRNGEQLSKPIPMRALVTISLAEQGVERTKKSIEKNPFGIYVTDFSWSSLK